jgi:hypothetical protein
MMKASTKKATRGESMEDSPYPTDKGYWDTRIVRGEQLGGERYYAISEVQFINKRPVYLCNYSAAWSPLADTRSQILSIMAAMGKPMIDEETMQEIGCIDGLVEYREVWNDLSDEQKLTISPSLENERV